MRTLTIGKLRGLQQCSARNAALVVLALDHRNNLRQMLNPRSPEAVGAAELVAFKQELVATLAPEASAVLLDPEYGAGQCIASGALPGSAGLVIAVEATGYGGEPTARASELLPGWSVAQSKGMGASAVKLLVYYHPDSPTAAETEALVRQVAEACAAADLPFFLEPLSYSLEPGKKLSPEQRRRTVIESARRLTPLGVDVLKAEFPLDITAHPAESEWREACAGLSQASAAPWVLLSASVGFETFLRQVAVACQAGASGVAVGRAVWQEAPALTGTARSDFLRGPALERMARITALCEALARPWTDFYAALEVSEEWYREYGT